MEPANFKQLKIINALIECGNATRAAAKLQVSAATISYTLGQLRKKSGHGLFNRVNGRLIPSQAALEMQAKYLELAELNSERKEITISTDAIIDFLYGQAESKADENSWSMRFIHMEPSTEERLNKLRNRIVDIDIGSRLPTEPSIVCAKLLESELCVMASQDHSFIQDEITHEEWFRCGHTRWLGDVATLVSMIEGLDLSGELMADRTICYESMNLLTLAYVCSRSDHIMLIPKAFIGPLSRFYRIKAVKPPPGLPIKFECFYHYHRSAKERVKSLRLSQVFADIASGE
ncbi:LysR family transcriptional regulator [Enterobacteriaceae bacterium 89]|nr:LysR family transcriptional regulator [Enterobacteriaceae bacterium 89]